MKVILKVESGHPVAGKECVLEQGSVVMGREPGCALRFGTEDGDVSRRHARVELADGACRLIDLSTNGTFVNGAPVTNAALTSGDLIQLGAEGPKLRVTIENEAGTPIEAATQRVLKARLPDKTGPQRGNALGTLLLVGLVGLGAFFGFLMFLMVGLELGPVRAFIGVAVAFAAAPFYLATWLWIDRYDPEPPWTLVACLLWGAGAATFVSGIVNSAFGAMAKAATGDAAVGTLMATSISAPLIEEAVKGLPVLLILLVFREQFDGIVDGIVYAGVVALGFAAVENILYYGRVVAKEGLVGLAMVFVLRGVLGPFSHAVFTSATGAGCGIARETHNRVLKVIAPPIGYSVAVFLHSLWNTLAGFTGSLAGYLVVYLVVWVPLFLVFVAGVLFLGYRESRIILRMLKPEVARGLITDAEAQTVASWVSQLRWLLSSLGSGGRFRARRQFLVAASRLALCYWHAETATASGAMTISMGQIPIYRAELERLRGAV